jgi:glycosyltransferase involved in cell wall biosynthesis
MRVGLSTIGLVPGTCGGIETYFRNLLEWLQRVNVDDEYVLLCDKKNERAFHIANSRFSVQSYNYAKPSPKWLVRGILRNLLNVDILVRELNGLDLDVVHHPFTVLRPAGLKTPSVLTFWDMQHEFYPEFFADAEMRRRKALYRPSAEEAARVIVSSGFTRQTLVERYGIRAEKIEVIYTGYGPEYRLIEDLDELAKIKARYGLTEPFLYYPAAVWPHKNHKILLAAVRLLIDRHHFDGKLVLTGVATGSSGELAKEIARFGLSETVNVLGYLPYQELPYLYNLATMLVFPSLFEGFGIPVVEAMACGCPVICANVTSLPEVIGEAGVMFDPHAVKDVAEKIWSVWRDPAQQRRMREAGLERAKLFNWQETAVKTVEVYKKAAGKA